MASIILRVQIFGNIQAWMIIFNNQCLSYLVTKFHKRPKGTKSTINTTFFTLQPIWLQQVYEYSQS